MNFIISITCDNFYTQCERIVTPILMKKPVVILNEKRDWILSCSEEARSLGIIEKRPYRLYQKLASEQGSIKEIIANMSLYKNMAKRLEECVRYFMQSIEKIALGEIFLRCECKDEVILLNFLRYMAQVIKKWTGIAFSTGVGPTKTLAKCANILAQKSKKSIYSLCNEAYQNEVLKNMNIHQLYGLSYEEGCLLQELGIGDILALRNTGHWKVMGHIRNLQKELQGEESFVFQESVIEEEMKHSVIIYSMKKYS